VVQVLREALAALASKEKGAPRQGPSPA
jgi:hypothetical protein